MSLVVRVFYKLSKLEYERQSRDRASENRQEFRVRTEDLDLAHVILPTTMTFCK
jgi:hypothetical protein